MTRNDVSRLDCVPTNAVVLLHIASNVDIVQQYRGFFETSENSSEKEKAGEKIELFWALSNQTTTNICDVFPSFVR